MALTKVDKSLLETTSGTADATTFLRGDGTWNAPAGGKILQVVSDTVPGGSTTTTSGTFDTKMTGLATIITPTSSSNKILLLGSCLIQTTSAEMASAVSLYKNASDFTETYDLISGVDPIISSGEGWGGSYRLGASSDADGM